MAIHPIDTEMLAMKLIGLLGGTSWPSTIEYYRILNELAQARLGGFHSANLLLRSIDFHPIKSRYHAGWDEIPTLLGREIEALARLGPACLVICNNTLHKAYDQIAPQPGLEIPVMHSVEVTAREAAARGLRRLLLLGTQFTMEDGFYQRGLERHGLAVSTPDAADRAALQVIQSQLAQGVMRPAFRAFFAALIARYSGVDAVVLACTEIPLVVEQKDYAVAILNPTELQCRAAFEFAVAD